MNQLFHPAIVHINYTYILTGSGRKN